MTERNSESQRELDSYRAYEMARDNSIPLGTIFKTTGGYRQGVVDARNAYSKKEDKKVIKSKTKKKTAKKTKTKRITKAERLRIEGERNCPKPVTVLNGSDGEVEVVGWYSVGRKKRLSYIRADITSNSAPASPIVELSDPVYLRRIAEALNAAADWMEEGK